MIRYTDLFQDRVVWAVNAQFPDLMVVCHDEKRLFSWNDKHFKHILVIKGKFWNLGSESDCEHQADQTKPCTYWDCVPVLHSHPHIGTCRSHRCWCIAGCRGERWSTHRCPRKSCHHPSGRNQASIYTDKNKQICGAICQRDREQQRIPNVYHQWWSKCESGPIWDKVLQHFSNQDTHKIPQIACISFSEAPVNPFLIQCFNLEDLSADLPVQATNGWAKGSALMCSLSSPAPHMAQGRLSVF